MTELILIFLARWLIYLVFLLIGVISWLYWGRKTTYKIALISIIAWLLGEILKYVFNIPRPVIATGFTKALIILDPSFPSTHTALLSSLGTSVLAKNKFLGLSVLALAVVVGAARVVLGVHYPIDIIGGFGLGVVASLILGKLLRNP